MPADSEFQRGEIVADRYMIEKVLGRGGMGEVYLAYDRNLRKQVALKFLSSTVASDHDAIELMRRESLKSLELTHPGIVRIYDFAFAENRVPFISMEYVSGSSLSGLKSRREERRFGWHEIEGWVEQLCRVLHFIHERGIVHRDLKPANLMLDEAGKLKVADLGISASIADSLSRMTRDMGSSGTPSYMGPQQLMGELPKATDDIYSFGATVYELLTGDPPFYSGDVVTQIREKEAMPIAERLAELGRDNDNPPEICLTVMRCLAKRAEDRPQNVQLLALELGCPIPNLTDAVTTSPISRLETPPETEVMSGVSRAGGRLWSSVGAVIGLVAAAVLAVIAFNRPGNDSTPVVQTPETNAPAGAMNSAMISLIGEAQNLKITLRELDQSYTPPSTTGLLNSELRAWSAEDPRLQFKDGRLTAQLRKWRANSRLQGRYLFFDGVTARDFVIGFAWRLSGEFGEKTHPRLVIGLRTQRPDPEAERESFFGVGGLLSDLVKPEELRFGGFHDGIESGGVLEVASADAGRLLGSEGGMRVMRDQLSRLPLVRAGGRWTIIRLAGGEFLRVDSNGKAVRANLYTVAENKFATDPENLLADLRGRAGALAFGLHVNLEGSGHTIEIEGMYLKKLNSSETR